MKKINKDNYRKDKHFPAVQAAFSRVLAKADVVTTVDVLIAMDRISQKDYEAWRRGQIPFLERVFVGNLGIASRVLRIIGLCAQTWGLVPSQTAYHRWGKGPKGPLRFSKFGDPNVEAAYSRHYLWRQSEEKKQERIEQVQRQNERFKAAKLRRKQKAQNLEPAPELEPRPAPDELGE